VNPLVPLASLALAGYAAYYLAACSLFPFGACRRCKGAGKLRNPLSKRMFRLCPRCEGTGRRVRVGRRIFEYLRREHAKGSK
jgi:hypothetical protein